jgi:phosphinothricin acetyltransferase
LQIRFFEKDDWGAVQDIYRQGIETKNVTFQSRVKTWDEWNSSVLPQCRLVAEDAGLILGWAALSSVSSREVYRGVAEVSVYVDVGRFGRGIGKKLLTSLVDESEREGFWTLQAVIFPENEASLTLHERCGFRVVGRRERIAKMDGRWRDTILMERRSKRIDF